MADPNTRETSMDVNALYVEDSITDRKVGLIRRMTPVKADGTPDSARPVLYMGQAEIMTNMGPMPINFEIQADNLEAAVQGFGPAAAAAVERTVQQIQEMRRQAASQLVVPQGGMPGGMGGMPPGRGGKIQLP
jgi:hypothetical protein